MRGNIDSRLALLDNGELDAIILAAAGAQNSGSGSSSGSYNIIEAGHPRQLWSSVHGKVLSAEADITW